MIWMKMYCARSRGEQKGQLKYLKLLAPEDQNWYEEG